MRNTVKSFVFRHIDKIVAVLAILSLLGACYQGSLWWHAHSFNIAFENRSIIKQPVDADHHALDYSIGYLYALDNRSQQAARAFTLAEASTDPEISIRAKFALGNMYFSLAMQSADIAAGGAHQQAVAQIELAREAYKGALRLNPTLYDARYNLELLDRLSPEHRTVAWKSETDGVTLQPFKRNGTAMMRDNVRRGLP